MKFLYRFKFSSQIIFSFAIIICSVALAIFMMMHTMLRGNYRNQESIALQNQGKQIVINIENRLEYFMLYLNLLSLDKEILTAMEEQDYKQVDACLQNSVSEFMRLNAGRVNAIRVHRKSVYTTIDGLGAVQDIFQRYEQKENNYLNNVLITGTYLNKYNEKVFSIFRKVYQTNMDREYLIEMCVYESEILSFFSKDSGENSIYIFYGDELMSMNDRQKFSELLYRQSETGGSTIKRDDVEKNKNLLFVSEEEKLGINILIGTDKAYLEKGYFSLLIEMLPVFFVIVFIAFLMAVLLSFRLNRRMKMLQQKIVDISDWQLSRSLYISGNDEFSILADELDKTRRRILELIEQNKNVQELMHVAEMSALRAQINSHFLFNSLSSIKWLAWDGEREKLEEAVDSLALFLRYSLEIKGNQVVLQDEVRQLQSYIYLQKLRYGDEINIQIDIEDSLMNCKTVRMILQPLVENAIFHGRRADGEKLNITIFSRQDEEFYYLTVEDDGNGISPEILDEIKRGNLIQSQNGYGLCNVIDRLCICLGKKRDDLINIESQLGVYTIITIRQPL